MEPWKMFLVFLIVGLVNAHEENADRLETLAEEIEDTKIGQPGIYLALDALERNLNRLVGEKTGTAEEQAIKVEKYRTRLSVLEENVNYIKSFVEEEKLLDKSLTDISTKQLGVADERLDEMKQFTETAKDEARVLLGSAEVELQSVKTIADKRNFNLGGAIFYGGHGSACVEGANECHLASGECRDGQCQCKPGLSYDRKTQSCVEVCESYGEDFEVVPNRVIRGNNSAMYEDVSLKECKKKCVEALDFECVTLEYFNWYRACYLSAITMLEAEESWEYNSAGTHFQRNCD